MKIKYNFNNLANNLSLKNIYNKYAFTLLELLVILSIIAILAMAGIPYYLESIHDARLSTLKQNVATMRKVINDFRGDQRRGPFRVEVGYVDPNTGNWRTLLDNPKSNIGPNGSELIYGPIQYDSTVSPPYPIRRVNLKYLPELPSLPDPDTGENLNWDYGPASVYFYDEDGYPNRFDIMNEFWFLDEDGNGYFEITKDIPLSWKRSGFANDPNKTVESYSGQTQNVKQLDFIDIVVVTSKGIKF